MIEERLSHHNQRVAPALDRLRSTVAKRPGFGQTTRTSVSTLAGTLQCSSREGDWEIDTDMTAAFGGDAAAPSPGTLVRAALGACLAMGYRLRAAELGVELTSVQVTVEAASELLGMLDPDAEAPPGFTALRYHVDIESPASDDDVARVVELGDQLSPVLDMLARANAIDRTVSITGVR